MELFELLALVVLPRPPPLRLCCVPESESEDSLSDSRGGTSGGFSSSASLRSLFEPLVAAAWELLPLVFFLLRDDFLSRLGSRSSLSSDLELVLSSLSLGLDFDLDSLPLLDFFFLPFNSLGDAERFDFLEDLFLLDDDEEAAALELDAAVLAALSLAALLLDLVLVKRLLLLLPSMDDGAVLTELMLGSESEATEPPRDLEASLRVSNESKSCNSSAMSASFSSRPRCTASKSAMSRMCSYGASSSYCLLLLLRVLGLFTLLLFFIVVVFSVVLRATWRRQRLLYSSLWFVYTSVCE